MRIRKLLPASIVTVAGALALLPAVAGAWAPASTATIHPGVMTHTDGAQCTANFVFTDGATVYLGQAAHCAGTGAQTETNGCESGSLRVGTPVEIDGASRPGTLAYSSWRTMQAAGEIGPDACQYNDFALVRVHSDDVGKVNPSVPGFGGPTALGSAGGLGSTVYSYGNSSLRFGLRALRPKQGTVVQSTGGGWSRTVYTATPGIPGDSGSGFLTGSGQAAGVLSTLQVLPVAGSNGVTDLGRALSYMKAKTSLDGVTLARGTEPFNGDLVAAITGG